MRYDELKLMEKRLGIDFSNHKEALEIMRTEFPNFGYEINIDLGIDEDKFYLNDPSEIMPCSVKKLVIDGEQKGFSITREGKVKEEDVHLLKHFSFSHLKSSKTKAIISNLEIVENPKGTIYSASTLEIRKRNEGSYYVRKSKEGVWLYDKDFLKDNKTFAEKVKEQIDFYAYLESEEESVRASLLAPFYVQKYTSFYKKGQLPLKEKHSYNTGVVMTQKDLRVLDYHAASFKALEDRFCFMEEEFAECCHRLEMVTSFDSRIKNATIYQPPRPLKKLTKKI